MSYLACFTWAYHRLADCCLMTPSALVSKLAKACLEVLADMWAVIVSQSDIKWVWSISESLGLSEIRLLLLNSTLTQLNSKLDNWTTGWKTQHDKVYNFTVDCPSFANFLLQLHAFNDFLGHHHHWMEWLGETIEINGFLMVLRSGNHWFHWFTMVVHHWSNDGMVAYHRQSLNPGNHCDQSLPSGDMALC